MIRHRKWIKRGGASAICCVLLMCLSLVAFAYSKNNITHYHAIFLLVYTPENKLKIAIREYDSENEKYFLLVDPNTLETSTEKAENYRTSREGGSAFSAELSTNHRRERGSAFPTTLPTDIKNTRYIKALERYSRPPHPLENDGLTQGETGSKEVSVNACVTEKCLTGEMSAAQSFACKTSRAECPIDHETAQNNGLFLTIDLCPSHRAFEKDFFEFLTHQNLFLYHHLIPVAISISGYWALQHPDEFNWLLQQQGKTLDITWINHSWTHFYEPKLPTENNFLLSNKLLAADAYSMRPSKVFRPQNQNTGTKVTPINFDQEVLLTEQLLLKHNQIPSIFFRFPGLISNEKLIKKLKSLGLIAVGTDAWIAKNQFPQNKKGSIILIHGNGNEPQGIRMILALMQREKLLFLPLSHAII